MRIALADASLAMPWDHEETTKSLMRKAKEESRMQRPLEDLLYLGNYFMKNGYARESNKEFIGGYGDVPPIPVLEAPAELKHYGKFIVYNGRHRIAAAKKAGITVPLLLLETDEDVKAIWQERIGIYTNGKYTNDISVVKETLADWVIKSRKESKIKGAQVR